MPVPALPRQLARTRNLTLGTPAQLTVSPDGSTVYFVRSRAGDDPVRCLWAADCASGRERLLADPRELLSGAAEQLPAQERIRRERAREQSFGIVGYAADDNCELLAFALSGQLWTVRPATGAVRGLPATEPVIDPRPDPVGRRVGYVGGGALRVLAADATDNAAEQTVAAPDQPDVSFGLAEHVAAEEMGRSRGYWWAPDGRRLLLARVDTARVLRWYIADPADPATPPAAIAYPAAGTANAEVSLWIADLAGPPGRPLTPVGWDATAFEYLTAAGWDARGPYAAVQDRSQRHVQVLGIDADTGAAGVLAEQHDDAWVTLVPGLPARTASGVLLTSGDSADTRRLLADGQPVTPPGLQLGEVVAVDGETVLFTASDEPTQTHLWAYDRRSGLCRLSAEPGVHSGTGRAGSTVLSSATPDRPGTSVTVTRASGDGEPVQIASCAERPVLRLRMELLTLGARELRAALFLPSWYREAGGPLPVLMDPYGGPAARKVTAEQHEFALASQLFAEHGFAVLVVDGAGTPGRGPAWERSIYLDFATPVLADQVAALTEAASRSAALDLTRVAIRGWSFGGFLAALAVLRRPDIFHAAVAGAPVLDQRMYDTHWRERYLGHPDEHPDAYGLADDNVVPAHTLRFSAALLAAGRPHEVLPLPRSTHMPSDQAVLENLYLHELDFLRRSLRLPPRA
ncbi:MAG TPA: prolyl oligopeptidase family serine peptidase [Streptosporangiaceae bacterium]|nr:prolyl oligopeptidase family serine peptidase [Streptosporangiaceae bacterium]